MLAFAATGCEDFLEAENKSAGQTADQYFATADGQEAYRYYAYSLLKPLVNSNYNELYDDGTDLYWPNRKTPETFNLYNIIPENSTVRGFYTSCYSLINAANGLIHYGAYQGEAKFLRSYGYYMLTQQFGAVPYVREYINNASRNYPRTPLKEIYDGILADLDEVVADAAVAAASAHDGIVSKQAANALAAKVALAAGWDLNDKSYFATSAKYAEAALNGVALYDSFADKWSFKNDESNKEEFFSCEYDRASFPGDVTSGGHNMQIDYSFYYGESTSNGSKKGSSARGNSLKSLYLYDKGDERYAATFAQLHLNYDASLSWPKETGYYSRFYKTQEQIEASPIAFYYAPWYVTDAEFNSFVNANKERLTKGTCTQEPIAVRLGKNPLFYYKGKTEKKEYSIISGYLTQAEGGCDCVMKWDDPETLLAANGKQCYRDIVLLHATETMLTAAEAYLMAGDEASALKMVNDVRKRAKASELASFSSYKPAYVSEGGIKVTLEALDVVLDERARELYGEPGRWMDLRRTKKLESYVATFLYSELQKSVATSPVNALRPIPTDEINSNNSISEADQNPGY